MKLYGRKIDSDIDNLSCSPACATEDMPDTRKWRMATSSSTLEPYEETDRASELTPLARANGDLPGPSQWRAARRLPTSEQQGGVVKPSESEEPKKHQPPLYALILEFLFLIAVCALVRFTPPFPSLSALMITDFWMS